MASGRFGRKYDRCYVATVTPFRQGTWEVDTEAFKEYLHNFVTPDFIKGANGVGGGVIINPGCGESTQLTVAEKKKNFEIGMEVCGGKLPVFGGIYSTYPEELVQNAKNANDLGLDGLFWFPPNADSVGFSVNSWIKWMNIATRAADLPLIPHPAGLPSGSQRTAEDVKSIILGEPNLVGWKMGTGFDWHRELGHALRELERDSGRHVGILTADGGCFQPAMSEDLFDGTLAGGWNYSLPNQLENLRAVAAGDYKKANEIWYPLSDMHRWVERSRYVRYKVLTWLRGLIPNPFLRPPRPLPTREEILAGKELVVRCGMNIISDERIDRVIKVLGPAAPVPAYATAK